MNWIIYGRKGSPVLWNVICQVTHNIQLIHNKDRNFLNLIEAKIKQDSYERRPKTKVLMITGPIAFTYAVLNTNGGYYEQLGLTNYIKYICQKNKKNKIYFFNQTLFSHGR